MKNEPQFRSDTERRITEALGAHFAGPDPGGFLARLGGALRGLPERDSEWDVLATWARPRVMAAAMAAGFLLGMAMWQARRSRGPIAVSPISVATVETARPLELNPVINVVLLEDR